MILLAISVLLFQEETLSPPSLANKLKEDCNKRDDPKDRVLEKGNWNEVLEWFSNLEKDDELADNIDLAAEHMRKGFKLRRIKL